MKVTAPLLSWLFLLTLTRLPWWYKNHLRRKCIISELGLAHRSVLLASLQLFHLIYWAGLVAQLLIHLGALLSPQAWSLALGWRQLALLPLALLATINFQGFTGQLLFLYQQSRQHWLPPQRGATGRWGKVFWFWLYLPTILTQAFTLLVVLPYAKELMNALFAVALCAMLSMALTILVRGPHPHALLGTLSVSTVNSLLILTGCSVIVPMINCVFYLYWVNFIARRSRG